MPDKLTAIRLKQQNGQYGPQIPVGAKAENVKYDNTYSVKEVLGNIDTTKGPLQEQIDNIDTSAIGAATEDWLDENITPSVNAILDTTLTLQDYAADAKAAGKLVTINNQANANSTKLHFNTNNQIVNILTTDDIDATLVTPGKAADAKEVGDAIIDINDQLHLVVKHNDIDFTNLTSRNGVIRDAGTYNNSSSYKSYFIPISGPSKVKITANSHWPTVFAFLKNDAVISDQTVPFATGETGRRTLTAGSTASYQTPDDCRCIYVYATGSGNTYTPSGMTVNTDVMSGDLVYAMISGETVAKYINSVGVIKVGHAGTSYQFPNNNYGAITLTAGNVVAHVSFVTSSIADLADNTSVPLVDGEPARHDVAAGETVTLFVPHDCEYIIIMRTYDNNNFTPSGGHIFTTTDAFLNCAASQSNGMSKTGVTACIIGASIEAGTTHEWDAPSVAHIDASKAYLTVALQNNGVSVTNLSQGGMGFVKASSHAPYKTAKQIVDETDFTNFESIYICLGFNDYNHGYPLGDPTDSIVGAEDVCGQMKYVIEQVYTSNPTIKMFIKNMGGSGGFNSDKVPSGVTPYTQADLQNAMQAVCSQYGIEMITLGAIANGYNKLTIYPDGVHPTAAIMALMAKDTTGRILFK